jgi:hypothetical protein
MQVPYDEIVARVGETISGLEAELRSIADAR